MTNTQDIFAFLTQVSNRVISAKLPEEDLARLQQLNLVRVVTADQYAQMTRDVSNLFPDQQALGTEAAQRAQLAAQVQDEARRTHSFLFRFEGAEKQAAEKQKAETDSSALRALENDLASRQQAFDRAIGEKASLDTLSPYGDGYAGLTSEGVLQLRDLGTRLYRVSDLPFPAYWEQSQRVMQDLTDLAARSAQYAAAIARPLGSFDASYLWAVAIGMAKRESDVAKGTAAFLDAYARLEPLTHNAENRLMSAEILTASLRSPAESVPILDQIEGTVRHLGVPREASLGVASILLLGQRRDGSFATENLGAFLRVTRSYESAALLAIVNRPFADLGTKFGAMRAMFSGWGYAPSEDLELSSSYLTMSDLPVEGLSPKLAVLTRGLSAYLQFPLVASAILASIPVLEANETLQLLELAYELIGRRAMPLSQPELICLAVRMIHGIRAETVTGLDTTAAAPMPVGFTYLPGQWFYFVPMMVTHGSYYSTFGVGGLHPAHVHTMGGFVG